MHSAMQYAMRTVQKDTKSGRTFAANSFLCHLDIFILNQPFQTNCSHRFNYVSSFLANTPAQNEACQLIRKYLEIRLSFSKCRRYTS